MKLLLDTLGGERGAGVIIEAGLQLCKDPDFQVQFIGKSDIIENEIRRLNGCPEAFAVIESNCPVAMDSRAVEALDASPEASVLEAMRALRDGTADAFVSPGHSGATVVAAREVLGRLPGVHRPGLCQILPRANGSRGMLIDAGATVTCTVHDLIYFAAMGIEAAVALLETGNPGLGLLNIGKEPCKGNKGLIAAYRGMQTQFPNFIGNLEGHDIWTGSCDVIITDGITGNILIKSAEGLYSIMRSLKTPADPLTEAGMSHFCPDEYGGAVLLGVNGVCIVCHGQAGTHAIVNAGKLAAQCIRHDLTNRLKECLSNFQIMNTTDEELTV